MGGRVSLAPRRRLRSSGRAREAGAADLLVRDAVRRTKAGDSGGLEYLYVRYAGDVRRHVASVVGNDQDAEDIAQTVFARLPQTIQRYEERGVRFSAWLLTVARNAALDELRKRRPIPASDVQDARPGAAAGAARSQAVDALREALGGLPEEQRSVLLLRHLVGLSPKEIASQLGKSEDAVHCLHHRGRGTARATLTRLGAAPATVDSTVR